MQSRISFDIHTHTTYSHGKGSIADNAAAAVSAGLERLGISDHGPGSFSYGIDLSRIPDMRRDIEACRLQFPDLKIELGVEANIINPDGSLDISKEDQKIFDYIIAGYHYSYLGKKPLKGMAVVLGGWFSKGGTTSSQHAINYNTDFMVSTILANKIDIVSHPGDKIGVDIDAIARACEQTGTIMEINDRHHCLTVEGIKTAMKYDVRFILSSDAHRPEAVGSVDNAWSRATEAGLDPQRIVNCRRV